MDASVTFLLDNLKQLLKYQYNLVAGAKDELKLLEDELDLMKGKLLDASKMESKDEVFKRWEKQIREAVYDVEDTIDEYVIQIAQQKATTAKAILAVFTQSKLAEKVKSLREVTVKPLFARTSDDFAIAQARDDLSRLSTSPGEASQTRQQGKDKRKKEPRQDKVVGFEDETATLIKYLMEESEELEVISIIGMPGLGKTTVAWKICQDSKIKYEFPTLIWVYISQEFNKREMLLTILKKFTQQDMSGNKVVDLSRKVRDYLKRGKFLICMDDVWTVEVWNEIKDIFPIENKTGKVLITSRHEDVALRANTMRLPHKLRFLTQAESWELLQLEVYGKLGLVDEGLQQLGQHIANQCDGLPLSIIVIGGILIDKKATPGGYHELKEEWRKVSNSVETYLLHGDKGKLLENIISLSYNKLPYDLRDCFLYLGMFPEDPEIPAWKLTQLWVAEGFIQSKPKKSVEEIAKENLKDLINRNLVMVDKTKPDGEVKTCRVHDTIREFCKTQADFNNQNLFQEIIINNEGIFEPSLANLVKYRRLCVHSYVHDFFKTKPKVPKSRSFICFSKAPIILVKEDIATVITAFTLLRVLEANTIKFPIFPAKITSLLHLRYLTLSSDNLEILPAAISRLWNLQTLIVDTPSRTLDIRADIWLMYQLRHLKTKASIILKKDGKGDGGENLQSLGRLSPNSCTDAVFNKAKNLNTLGVRGDLSLLLHSHCLKKLKLLNKLKLVHDSFLKVASENPLSDLPPHNAFPPNLRILILSGTYLDWPRMSTLGQLGALEVLKLKDHAFVGNFWDAFDVGFHHLELLYIERTDLRYWTMKGVTFPELRTLVLKNCEKLQGVPFVLKEKLEMLCMERVTPYAVFSAQKIEQAKLDMPGAKRGGFKLVIAPGDQVHDS